MPPTWVHQEHGLSSDPALRELQRRWLLDELWIRRLVMGMVLLVQLAGLGLLLIDPSVERLAGVGTTSLTAIPVWYFFGERRRSGT
jgi:hypothetical protein